MKLNKKTMVGVAGAGAMGSGIAQVAATFGHAVVLYDADEAAVERALGFIGKTLARSVEKGKLTPEKKSGDTGPASVARAGLKTLPGCVWSSKRSSKTWESRGRS